MGKIIISGLLQASSFQLLKLEIYCMIILPSHLQPQFKNELFHILHNIELENQSQPMLQLRFNQTRLEKVWKVFYWELQPNQPVLVAQIKIIHSVEPLHNGQLGDRIKWPLWGGRGVI